MYVYIVVQTYSTGVSNNKEVFSSAKKAQEHIDWILETEEKHGWKVERNWMLGQYPVEAVFHRISKGDQSNTTLYHYEKHEVI